MLFRMPICFDFCSTDTISTDAIANEDAIRLKAEIRYAEAAAAVNDETNIPNSRDHERASNGTRLSIRSATSSDPNSWYTFTRITFTEFPIANMLWPVRSVTYAPPRPCP